VVGPVDGDHSGRSAGSLGDRDQDRLASMLRSLSRSVQDRNGSETAV